MSHAQLLYLLHTYSYFIMIPLAIIEGPIVMMIAGFLFRLNLILLLPAYIALMIGDLLGDVIWYSVGYHFARPFINRFGKYFSVDEESVSVIERFFKRHTTKILIISKLTMGFGFAVVTLFTAGLVKINFKYYFILNIIGEFFWTGVLMAIGYFFGNFYATIDNVFGKVAILVLFVLAFIALFGFGKYVRKTVIKSNL